MNERQKYLIGLNIDELNKELVDEGFLEYQLQAFNDVNWSCHKDRCFSADSIKDLSNKLIESRYFYINSLQQIVLFTEDKAKEFLVEKILNIIG